MKKLLIAVLIVLLPVVVWAYITLPSTHHWSTISPWTSVYGTSSIDTTSYAPGSSGGSLKFTYPAGWAGGNAPDKVYATFTSDTDEIWFEYWFKYSSNWESHPVGDKQSYWTTNGTVDGEVMMIRRNDNGGQMCFCWQSTTGGARAFNNCGNTANSAYIPIGVWKKFTGHIKLNTPGLYDGVYEGWIDDVQTHDYHTVRMRMETATHDFHSVAFVPVWGGTGSTKDETDYFWVDFSRIQTVPFGDTPVGDQTPPYVDTRVPAASATGVAVDTNISFHIKDSGDGVDPDTITMTLEGVTVAPTVTGTAADYTVTYNPSDFANLQTVDIVVNASDLADPANAMSASSWSFTTVAAAPDPFAITTTTMDNGTVGTLYTSDNVATTGGTTPVTCAVTSGAMPTGTFISPNCVPYGVPTTSGSFTWTVTATDNAAATDTQEYTVTISPLLPAGQTVIWGQGWADTYVNSGAAITNYSDNADTRLYQWPMATPSNRGILQYATLGLPDNASVTSATLYLYKSGPTATGATDPMKVYVYPVTGQTWTIANVTWNSLDNAAIGAPEDSEDVWISSEWISFTITEAVKAAYLGDYALTLLLDGGSDGAADTNRRFTSVDTPEEAYWPVLVVTYTQLVAPEGPSISGPGKMRVSKLKGVVK